MRNDTYISNLDALRTWFELNQNGKEPKPYFTLWSGREALAGKLILRNEEVGDGEKSWELLEDMITLHSDGGGTFRVFLTSKPGYNIGVTTIVRMPSPVGSQVAGINGASTGNFGIYGSAKEMIDAEIERRMEVYELKRKLEDMMESNQAGMGAIDQFKQLMEYPAFSNLIQAFGMKMMNMQPAQPPPTPPYAAGNASDSIAGTGAEGYDYDVIEPALDKMRRVFSDVEVTLDNLADWILNNPDQARMIFGQIKQPSA